MSAYADRQCESAHDHPPQHNRTGPDRRARAPAHTRDCRDDPPVGGTDHGVARGHRNLSLRRTRTVEVARIVGVDKTFASRLMSALRTSDSLAALSLLPGVVPLRQFVAAAKKHGAGVRGVQAAERQLRAFDHDLQRVFGTRTRLDAVIADALPRRAPTPRRYGSAGCLSRDGPHQNPTIWRASRVVHPSERDPKRATSSLAAFVGIHRLRPTGVPPVVQPRALAARGWRQTLAPILSPSRSLHLLLVREELYVPRDLDRVGAERRSRRSISDRVHARSGLSQGIRTRQEGLVDR